ncbi:MAG: VCBS repeat-containing protein [Verrucomicrobia bacterium]|nr:VCBS repeat-containing protein [Verrucomicrobiota bacterium]
MVTNLGGSVTSRVVTLTLDATFTKIMTGVIVTDAEGSVSGNWVDVDNDGYPDLFVANSDLSTGVRNTLYQNNSGTNFSRVTASPFATDYMRAWCAAGADYNNDGNVDLIVANIDGGVNAQRLYRNNGDGTFTAVVDSALRSDTTGAGCLWWIDFDNDGFLDLFVAKGSLSAANDCLFRNNGDGTFKKMTVNEVGPMLSDGRESSYCLSADYDNDGRQELYVVHNIPQGGGGYDYTNCTWRFQANGTFVRTTPTGIGNNAPWRWWGDYDNDGWLDAITMDVDPVATTTLFRNLGAVGFSNATSALNITTPGQVNLPVWGDYDNDGWLDLFWVSWYGTPTFTPNGFFHNNGNGTFTQILTGSPVTDGGRRFTPSWIDYDNDGFLDLFLPWVTPCPR